MRKTFYAEVDLTNAVVNLVKQGHYSGVSVAIFGPKHLSNPKTGDHYLPNRRDKTAQPWPFAKPTIFHLSYLVPNCCRFTQELSDALGRKELPPVVTNGAKRDPKTSCLITSRRPQVSGKY